MKILLDLNVLLDVAYRTHTFPGSYALYEYLRGSALHHGVVPLCGYTTLYYVLRQHLHDPQTARAVLLIWHQHFALVPFTERMAQAAHRLPMADFEDACVAISALESQCDVIATRNVSDFANAPVPAATPETLLMRL